jgi:hypothetical protein
MYFVSQFVNENISDHQYVFHRGVHGPPNDDFTVVEYIYIKYSATSFTLLYIGKCNNQRVLHQDNFKDLYMNHA